MVRTILSRQAAALSAIAICASSALGSVDASRMTYDVLLDDRVIGKHVFEFAQSGDELLVQSDVDMSVKLLFVEVFNYEHSASERWRDGCLQALSSKTRQNGEHMRVQAAVAGGQLVVERLIGDAEASEEPGVREADEVELAESAGCVAGYAYWDKTLLDRAKLLNAQLGELDDVRFEADGVAELEWLSRLGDEKINRYALTSNEARIELWYDEAGQWLGLRTKRGSRWLEYRLDVVEPAVAPIIGDQLSVGGLTLAKPDLVLSSP